MLNNGDRTPEVIKIYFSDLNDYKFSESILDYLNKKEYSNVEKYIYLQKRILKHHIKNKRYDSIRVVENSILVMEKFKDHFIK